MTSLPAAAAVIPSFDRGLERRHVADHVIGGQHEQDGVRCMTAALAFALAGTVERHERRHRNGGRGIAADGLEDDRLRRRAELQHLLGHDEAMALVADDDGRREIRQAGDALHRLLQHRLLADQWQQLLGVQLARERPEPRAGAAGEDQWSEHLVVPSDAEVAQAEGLHQAWIVDVAAVEDDRVRQRVADRVEIRAAEFLPLGDDRERVGAVQRGFGAWHQRQVVTLAVDALGLAHGDRIVGAHLGARAPQRLHEFAAGASRMSSVLGLNARPHSAIVLPLSLPSK